MDVVITDLTMPERDGLWLWRQALLQRPELRGRFVLIASEPLPKRRSLELFGATERVLMKPLAVEELWREVREAAGNDKMGNDKMGEGSGERFYPVRA